MEIPCVRVTAGKIIIIIIIITWSICVGLRPLACWDCGFESRREALMYLVNVEFEIEVSAIGRSLFQGSPTECAVSECN